jgi:hypothetical protein
MNIRQNATVAVENSPGPQRQEELAQERAEYTAGRETMLRECLITVLRSASVVSLDLSECFPVWQNLVPRILSAEDRIAQNREPQCFSLAHGADVYVAVSEYDKSCPLDAIGDGGEFGSRVSN